MTKVPNIMEISRMIFPANQWTGFYMIRNSVMEELRPMFPSYKHKSINLREITDRFPYDDKTNLTWAKNTNLTC